MGAELHKTALLAVGAASVAVGAYLPWMRTNPNLPPDAKVPTIYYTGMDAGVEAFDFALLGAVVLALLVCAVSTRIVIQTATTLTVGLGTALFPVYYLSRSTLFGFSATFILALGWYLTVLGGVLIAIRGGLQLPAIAGQTRPRTLRE